MYNKEKTFIFFKTIFSKFEKKEIDSSSIITLYLTKSVLSYIFLYVTLNNQLFLNQL